MSGSRHDVSMPVEPCDAQHRQHECDAANREKRTERGGGPRWASTPMTVSSTQKTTISFPLRILLLSLCRFDVLIEVEEVCRIILLLDGR